CLPILGFALPASLMFRAIYALNTAISRPRVVMAIQVAGLALKVGLSTLLVFGLLGLPRLGVGGAALSTFVVVWLVLVAGLAFTSRETAYRRFAIRFAWPSWAELREQLRLGVPMGLG